MNKPNDRLWDAVLVGAIWWLLFSSAYWGFFIGLSYYILTSNDS